MNSTPKHTPGPWLVDTDGTQSGKWIVVFVDDESFDGGVRELLRTETIATSEKGEIDQWHDKSKRAEIEANARLIAAAPDLLKALKTARESVLVNCAIQNGSNPHAFAKMIAKHPKSKPRILETIDTAITQAQGE